MNRGHVDILGIRISVIDQPGLLQSIDQLAREKKPALVNNVNAHACNLAYEQPEFREILNSSEVVFCDGFGVKLAGWLTGKKLGQRMTPPDWIDDLFSLCQRKGYRIYFLGDTEEVINRFAETVQAGYPELQVAGWHHGFFDLEGPENDRLTTAIAETDADIIITGMGMPRQEFWAREAKSRLPKGVMIATGALFRWYTGYEKRAPRWVTDLGLEWLARLIVRPRQLFKRYVVGIPLFIFRVFTVQGNGQADE